MVVFSPGSAETNVGWDGTLNGHLMASCFKNILTKNYQNLLICFQVTVENVRDVFFETQCISQQRQAMAVAVRAVTQSLVCDAVVNWSPVYWPAAWTELILLLTGVSRDNMFVCLIDGWTSVTARHCDRPATVCVCFCTCYLTFYVCLSVCPPLSGRRMLSSLVLRSNNAILPHATLSTRPIMPVKSTNHGKLASVKP